MAFHSGITMHRYLLLCALASLGVPSLSAEITWSREISRIAQGKCQRCHRPNDIAPFALLSYDDAATWAQDIGRVVGEKIMPPWKPVAGHGEFKHSYALTEEERFQILDWVKNGAPEGDPADLPEPTAATGEWQLGEPDAVFTMKEEYTPRRVKDLYRCFVLPTDFSEQQYVSAVQVLPGNRKIVHHVLLYLDMTGKAEEMDGKDGTQGYDCFGGPGIPLGINSMLGGWVPGTQTQPLPDGIGIQLPSKARIVMQVHYFPNGRPAPDQTKIGLYFSKTKIERRLIFLPILNDTFKIEPGVEDHLVKSEFMIPPLLDAKAILIAPHMHLLGRKISVDLVKLDRSVTPMVLIDDWDFNWQGFYEFVDPVPMKAFSTVRLTCNFDNSEKNPKNPNNPLIAVGWGEGTESEMCLAFLGVTFDRENLLPFQKDKPTK